MTNEELLEAVKDCLEETTAFNQDMVSEINEKLDKLVEIVVLFVKEK